MRNNRELSLQDKILPWVFSIIPVRSSRSDLSYEMAFYRVVKGTILKIRLRGDNDIYNKRINIYDHFGTHKFFLRTNIFWPSLDEWAPACPDL